MLGGLRYGGWGLTYRICRLMYACMPFSTVGVDVE